MIREKKEAKKSNKEESVTKQVAKKVKAELPDKSEPLETSPSHALLQPGYLCVPSADMPTLTPLIDTCGLSLIPIESIWDGNTVGFNSRELSLDAIPARLIGFISVSTDGAGQIEALRSAWMQQLKFSAPDAMACKTPVDFAEIQSWLVRRLVKAQTEMALRNSSLMRSLCVVRAEHEAVQEAFQRLESYAYATSLATRQIALALEPRKNELLKIGVGPAAEVRQLIPVSSLGVCDLAIHVLQVPSTQNGTLDVSLSTLEDACVVGTWSITSSQIRPGWLRLGLERALSADERSLSVSLLWSGAGEITLSLAEPHPEPRWCAIQRKKSASGPLSMKMWRSFPGTRAVPAANSQLNASVESRVRMLYSDDLRKVESAGSSQEGIWFDEGGNSLLVHPVMGAVAWARLSQVIPAGTVQIFADVETKNEKAGPVEYAIAVAPSAGKSRKGAPLQFKQGAISEWVCVDAMTQSQVHLHFDPAVQADHDLYLGTRLKAGDSNAFCWAHFRKIRVSN